jgi:carbamoyl-phosphate synthase small subunit
MGENFPPTGSALVVGSDFPYSDAMPSTVEQIIDRLGGAEAAAHLAGVGTEAIRKWRQSRSIPARHWPALLATGLALSDLPGVPPQTASSIMHDADTPPPGATAALVLQDGSVLWGVGFGAHTAPGEPASVGEVCFNTALTGYQETLTDPSYAGQIITFTFPHIGNVGTNPQDNEAARIAARGLIVKQDITAPSNWRSTQHLDAWLRAEGIPGIGGVDTRALTIRIRDLGAPNAVIAHDRQGRFDLDALRKTAAEWPGLENMDLAKDVTCARPYDWNEGVWKWFPQRHAAFSKPPAVRNIVV